ncbi:MAG: endolytic transglycosylase MltG, partial [Pseudomonadota bacterium]
MWRHLASNAISLLVVTLFLAGGAIVWAQGRYASEGPLAEAICLQVVPNSTMGAVARDLEEQEAVHSRAIFRMAADYTDRAGDLKAGSFLIEPGASMAEILDIVTIGGRSTCGTEVIYRIGVNQLSVQVRELDPATNAFVTRATFTPAEDALPGPYESAKDNPDTRFRIAVAEGATSWQIVNALGDIDVLEGEAATIPPEGALAPRSYEIVAGEGREALLLEMARAQEATLAEAWAARAAGLPYATETEALIMASII